MKCKEIRCFVLFLLISFITCCIIMVPGTSYAWATKTHGYSANLLLKDAADGFVTVDGVDYRIPNEFLTALTDYPAAFRAGTLGPDFFPDTLTGQTYIHPYNASTGTSVGDWLMLLVDAVNAMPKDNKDRMEALAFTLGMAVHYAGDEFGHDFINAFAGGAYPAYSDVLKESSKGDLTKLFYILRHMTEEKYMDSLIGTRLGVTDVNTPETFLLHTWICDGPISNGIADIYAKYENGKMSPYKYLIDYRSVLSKFADTFRDPINVVQLPIEYLYRKPEAILLKSAYPVPEIRYLVTRAVVSYIDAWIEDVDKATVELVRTFNAIAEDVLKNQEGANHKGTVDIVEDRLKEWENEYGIYMAPWSDWITSYIKEIADTLSETEEAVKDLLGITILQETWDEFTKELRDAGLQWGLSFVGLDYKICRELIEQNDTELMLKLFLERDGNYWHDMQTFEADLEAFLWNPEQFRDELNSNNGAQNNYNEFLTYMNAFQKDNGEELDAFHNTLLMGKLILMGPDNLNSFFRKYGAGSSFSYAEGRIMMDEFRIKIHTAKNAISNGMFNGTDDNVYIDVYIDGEDKPITKLLDKSDHNDFESNNWDEFIVELPYRVSPDRFYAELRIEKIFPLGDLDNWAPDEIRIICRCNGYDVLSEQKLLDKKYTFDSPGQTLPLSFKTNADSLVYTTAFNPAIISYIKSNDNSTQWVNNNNLLWSDMTARQNILYEVFHGFKPDIKLSVDNATFQTGTTAFLHGTFSSYWNGIAKERRDRELLLDEVNETMQQACSGTVKIMEVSGSERQILTSTVVDGEMTVDLSTLSPGSYRLRADYDGDSFNGSAKSNIITLEITGSPDNKDYDLVNPDNYTGRFRASRDFISIQKQEDGYTAFIWLNRADTQENATLSLAANGVILRTKDIDENPLTFLFYKDDNDQYILRTEESSLDYPAPGTIVIMQKYYATDEYDYTLLKDGTAEIIDYYGSDIMTIPDKLDGFTVTSIGEFAFHSHFEISDVIIPDSIISIGDCAFANCTELKTIIIPDSVTSIGEETLSDCLNLTAFVYYDSYARKYCEINNIPYALLDSEDSTNGNTSVSEKTFESEWHANNGKPVIMPEEPPEIKRKSSGAPFVSYTLAGNGQLIENYYDAAGSLRYVLGNASDLYLEAIWPSQIMPAFPETDFGFIYMTLDDEGKLTSEKLLFDNFNYDVFHDHSGNTIISVPEITYGNESDEPMVSIPARMVQISHNENGKIITYRISNQSLLLYEIKFVYDYSDQEWIEAVNVSYALGIDNYTQESYTMHYSDDLIDRIVFEDSEYNKVKELEYTYKDGLRNTAVLRSFESDGSINEDYYQYHYSADGFLLTLDHTANDVFVESYNLQYDVGRLAQFTLYKVNNDGQTAYIDALYYYDEKGFLETIEYYALDKYTYEANRKVIKYYRNADGSVKELDVEDRNEGTLNKVELEAPY